MIGTVVNVLAICLGTSIGCWVKGAISQKYENVLYATMGLAAVGIGMENVVTNMPKSHYPVMFIIALALGSLVGTGLDIDGKLRRLIGSDTRVDDSDTSAGPADDNSEEKKSLAKGLSTACLLYCIGALSIVGPVMSAVKGDNTMLFTNATLDFVTAMVFGASFGWGMLAAAPVLFCWQGSIWLVAKFLSASFFSAPLIAEISIVGGFMIASSGLSLLKIKDLKTVNMLPSLLVPLIFFLLKGLI